MTDPHVRISIITPCLNRAEFIARAIDSVTAQNYPQLEHIVVDGGSTDETLAILAQYPSLRLVSGPDQGMYEAINKGLQIASGEIVGFLNSDDFYSPNILFEIADRFRDPLIQAVTGQAETFSQTPDGDSLSGEHFSPENANLVQLAITGNPFFNAWFFRRTVFEQIGHFDTSYRIVADREFMLRFALSTPNYAIFPQLIYHYQQHTGSLTFDQTNEKFERIAQEHITLTGLSLAKNDLPPSVYALLRQLRTRDTVKMALINLLAKNLLQASRYGLLGWRYDPLWPLHLVQKVLSYTFKKHFR